MNRLYGAWRLFICRHFHNKYKLVKVILRQDDSEWMWQRCSKCGIQYNSGSVDIERAKDKSNDSKQTNI